jgi:transcriptional regulator with XRE-family HTH domain
MKYHYTECGLNNVVISGLEVFLDDEGDETIQIPYINDLHRAIASGIVLHNQGISGAELRFLRSEMGMTQAELAALVHKDKQSIGRWERAEWEIDGSSETIIRKLAIEKLDLDVDDGIDVLSKKSVATVHDQTISIVANDSTYSLEELQVA